jgi:hypothetical protein
LGFTFIFSESKTRKIFEGFKWKWMKSISAREAEKEKKNKGKRREINLYFDVAVDDISRMHVHEPLQQIDEPRNDNVHGK